MHAFVALRISMTLEGQGVDPEGRDLVLSGRDLSRADAAPPDCLVLSPEGEVLGRFRSGGPPNEALGLLEALLGAHPEYDPGPLPPRAKDPLSEGYEAGLKAFHEGDIEGAYTRWEALITAHPEHPLRHRIAWHRQRPVFLPPHPDLGGTGGTWERESPAPPTHAYLERLRALRADPEVRWSSVGLPFRRIPAGTFTMGGSPAQKASELPRRRVTLSRDYWLALWPLTLGVWASLMEPDAPAPEERLGLPKTGLSVADVQRICERLEARDGWRYRLPSEAEWERAARGGIEGAPYPWGDAPIDPSRCNYLGPAPLPVASYPPNGYGLFDMVGNCPEWTSDYHLAEAYALTPPEVTDPEGPPRDDARSPVTRVVRGGACQRPFMALLCRNSRRLAAPESPPPWMGIGARLVAEIP